MTEPIFPYDAVRAEALADHLDCPVEEIKIVEGEGLHVYTRIEPGQTQEEAEEENGRWFILPEEEFDRETLRLVREDLHNCHAESLCHCIFPHDDSCKFLFRRAVGLWHGRMNDDKIPSLKDAIEYAVGKKVAQTFKHTDACELIAALELDDELAGNIVPLVEFMIEPPKHEDREKLCLALQKVVNVERLVDKIRNEDGWGAVWGNSEYETSDVGETRYSLLRKE